MMKNVPNMIHCLFKSFLFYIESFLKKVIYYSFEKTLMEKPRHDDIYLVSYPKSGATWLDFMMANIHTKLSKLEIQVNFFNIHMIIPDVHFNPQADNFLKFPGIRMAKSHSSYNPYYKHIVYLVRDPRSVMVSYYYFLRCLGEYEGDLSSFIRSKRYGICAWCEHISGWVEKTLPGTRIVFIRYEDMMQNPRETLGGLYNDIGFIIADEVLDAAIIASSFSNMQSLEKKFGYGGADYGRDLSFVRKGNLNGWKDDITEQDQRFISEKAYKWLNKFNYE